MSDCTRASQQRRNPVAIVGAGVIGVSWATIFLQSGYNVCLYDSSSVARKDARERITQLLGAREIAPATLTVAATLAEAVRDAGLAHEAAPESLELKRELLADIQRAAPLHTLIASATSSLRHSDVAAGCPAPARIITAHPFNPPELVPLVEIFGIDDAAVDELATLYRGLGKQPVVLRREMIGHIANRLSSALWREALYILQEGVASVADIDRAVTAGPGLRWAINGPFMTYHLGGGREGIEGYLRHLGDSQVRRWEDLGTPNLDAALTHQVVEGVHQATQGRSTC